jgi:hypothetical protein
MDIKHDYQFTAVYEDNHTIERLDGDEDISVNFPDKSKFTDVLDYEKTSKLISFVLHNAEHSFGVDLYDGHFEIDGIPFWQHRPDLTGYKDFRVIYYRTVQRVMSQTGEQLSGETLAYTIGWQVTHKGENVQRTITF